MAAITEYIYSWIPSLTSIYSGAGRLSPETNISKFNKLVADKKLVLIVTEDELAKHISKLKKTTTRENVKEFARSNLQTELDKYFNERATL